MTDTGKPVWLEVAINGPWSRDLQPLAPRSDDAIIADGIACAGAGASIIHLHIFDATGDRQVDDAAQYEKIIRAIHAETGAIVYGTLPFHASSADRPLTAVERYAAVEELAKRGAIEWSIVDPGSVNISSFQAIREGREGFVYLNPEDHIRWGLTLARDHGFTPSYAIYEPGFLRQGAALHAAMPGTPRPVYRFMFSEAYSFGFPPKQFALDAYLNLMAEAARGAPWMVAGLGVDITPMIGPAVNAGGHVRVGLEDAPVRDTRSNLDWVAIAVDEVENAGGRVATPDEVRAALTT